MKIRIFLSILALICYFSFTSCDKWNSKEKADIEAAADSFATKFYTWRFKDAMKYSTNECQQYIKFLSSNVHDADLEELHNSDKVPSIDIGDITLNETNTEATVNIILKDVYLMDTLGTRVHIYPEATQTLSMKKYGDTWQVSHVCTEKQNKN